MISRASPTVTLSFSHARAVSTIVFPRVCITPRKAVGEQPTVVLKAQTHEKCTHRVHTHTTFEAEGIKRGDYQACSPLAACLRFPQRGLWSVAPTSHCVPQTVHTTPGEARLLGQLANAAFTMVTKTFDKAKTSVPKSHVGRFSEG